MQTCEVCGNSDDKAITVMRGNEKHVFDSFECAIQMMAPICEQCECRIVGHGVESDGKFYCCAHCARKSGIRGLDDRTD